MTRKRWVTFSRRTAMFLDNPVRSNIEDKFILILAEYGTADDQGSQSADERGGNRLPTRQLAIIDSKTEAVDHVDEGIELEEPLHVRRHKVQSINDRSEIEPG